MLNVTDSEYYQAIKDYSTIMIFGANWYGQAEHRCCKKLKKDISCYLVSSQSTRAGSVIQGVPVRQIDEISSSEKRNGLVIVGRAYDNHEQTVRLLQEHGFSHIIPGVNQSTYGSVELNEEQAAALRGIFGSDLLLHIPSVERETECNVKIYAVTSTANFHKANRNWSSKYIEYIQAGAALTKERICAITDDTGDNISQYNRYLNEATAGYWIAKNDVNHEYVGLYHYSRGLNLSDRQIEWIAEHDVDVVLCNPGIYRYDMLSFTGSFTYEAACRFAPDYVDAASCYLKNRFLCHGNIQIAKHEIFREFYEWVLPVLKGMGELYPDAILENERYFGYAMESMTYLWYVKNAARFRFAFAPILHLY